MVRTRKNHPERGAAHLVLVLAFVVALVGVLGFVGYNSWQKQNANAGGESSLGRTMPPVEAPNIVFGDSTDAVAQDTAQKSMTAKTTRAAQACTPLKNVPWEGSANTPAFPSSKLPKNKLKIKTLGATTYQVYGNTRAEVRQQLKACAPTDSKGKSFAYSRYETGFSSMWWLAYSKSQNKCKITAFSIGFSTGRLLPRYVPTTGAADGLNDTMTAYIAAIRAYNEDMHSKVRNITEDFRKSWVGYTRSGTCGELADYLSAQQDGHSRLWGPWFKAMNKAESAKKVKFSDF